VAGRIPGSQNAFFEEPVPGDVLDAPELAVYCGSGVTAAVQAHRLVRAGRDDVRLYPGSFSEWCRRPDHPIERGDPT
jgi:3-mercaptopyruvate sulfurtransferase SseA